MLITKNRRRPGWPYHHALSSGGGGLTLPGRHHPPNQPLISTEEILSRIRLHHSFTVITNSFVIIVTFFSQNNILFSFHLFLLFYPILLSLFRQIRGLVKFRQIKSSQIHYGNETDARACAFVSWFLRPRFYFLPKNVTYSYSFQQM